MASIDLLCIINEERKKFGLRDSDFHRYRTHCTQKLKTLRKSTGVQQAYNPKTKQLVKKSLADKNSLEGINDVETLKYLLINVFQVEQAWASSRELKEEVQSILKKKDTSSAQQTGQKSAQTNSRGRTGASRVRHHSNNRLTKAIHHSDRLLAQCRSSTALSIRTLAQVHVHRLYMRGLLDFELARWDASMDHFALSSVILKALANSTHQADHKKRAIFDELMDELAPMIRYCAYKNGANALDMDTFCEERVAQNTNIGEKLVDKDWPEIYNLIESSKQISPPTIELKWISKTIPIRNPELVDLITSLQKADQALLANLKGSLGAPPVSIDPSQSAHLNKKQKRQIFLQSKHPKMAQKNFISPTAAFDQALSTYVDVETHLQALIESNNRALELNSTIQRFDQQSPILATIHSIVGFRLLSTRVNRDVELVHKLEKKLATQESRVVDRITKSPKSYQQINQLVLLSSTRAQPPSSKSVANTSQKSSHETDHVRTLLIKRRQAKVFPSLLKLFDDIIFNLDRIKQLKLIEDDHELSVKIECKVSFFKTYRCLIQSKSYLLVDKFLESYVLQQKANFYLRQAKMNIEEVEEQEYDEDDVVDKKREEIQDLNEGFLRFERGELEAVSEEVQERLRKQILDEWWKSDRTDARGAKRVEGEAPEDSLARLGQLEKLSLVDDDRRDDGRGTEAGKTAPQVFDLAFNYVTQFDWARLDPHASHLGPSARPSKTQHTSRHTPFPSSAAATAAPSASTLVPTSQDHPHSQDPAQSPPAPAKKSGGLWGFFTRS
ncbi:hypothetical protein PCANC_22874 [Puccinia coronata f. sp. avenae]|nr:hypothetical protein PCANC_22874 [Puccinia coronata f. sp. avenae]